MPHSTLLSVPASRLPQSWLACADVPQAARHLQHSAGTRWPDLQVELLEEVDSTNSELMRRARVGQHGHTLLLARRQSAGRGRLGREWQTTHTPALMMSMGLPMAPRDWSGLSLVVGLVLAQQLGLGVGIKWPNDLWHQQRKLCGILVETAALHLPGEPVPYHDPYSPYQPARYVVIGMGVNLGTPVGDGLRTQPTGLAELLGLPPTQPASLDPQELTCDLGASAMARVLPALLAALAQFEEHGFAPFEAAYAELDVLRGQRVSLSDGRQGLCVGVDQRGAMCVHIDGEAAPQPIDTGEISIRPLA